MNQLKQVFCKIPFSEFHIYKNGLVANCCYDWLPTPVGNILKDNILDLLENEIAKKIQSSVTDGSYHFCKEEYCPFINEYKKNAKTQWPFEQVSTLESFKKSHFKKYVKLYLSFDYSCNLSCPSCRNEKIFYDKHTADPELLKIYDRVSNQISKLLDAGVKVDVNITGSGDAFASPLYYDLMNNFPRSKNLRLHLSTNGIMMTEKKMAGNFTESVHQIFISVDSHISGTYAKIRRGGNFKTLENNLLAFDRLVQNGHYPNLEFWQLNFIVQSDNYAEMGDFVEWSSQFKTLNNIFFTKILDWNHLPQIEFNKTAVWKEEHPEHSKFKASLKDKRLQGKKIILGNLLEYIN